LDINQVQREEVKVLVPTEEANKGATRSIRAIVKAFKEVFELVEL